MSTGIKEKMLSYILVLFLLYEDFLNQNCYDNKRLARVAPLGSTF